MRKVAITPNPNPVKLWLSLAVSFPKVDYFIRPMQFSAAAWTSVTPTEIQANTCGLISVGLGRGGEPHHQTQKKAPTYNKVKFSLSI